MHNFYLFLMDECTNVFIDDCIHHIRQSCTPIITNNDIISNIEFDYFWIRKQFFDSKCFHQWFQLARTRGLVENLQDDLINIINDYCSPQSRYSEYSYLVDEKIASYYWKLLKGKRISCELYRIGGLTISGTRVINIRR